VFKLSCEEDGIARRFLAVNNSRVSFLFIDASNKDEVLTNIVQVQVDR
jgi:hypothetical protein